MAKTLDFKDFMVVDYAPGMDPIIKRAAKKRKQDSGAGSNAEYSSTYAPDEQIDTIDEALNPEQRRARARTMKRLKSRIELGRKRSERQFANPERLMNRARRQARLMLFKKLTKGQPKSELTYQRRQEIEKRLDSPAMKKIIGQIAIKMLPKERQAEVQRHRPGGSQGSQQ
jgi:hypothetical protein